MQQLVCLSVVKMAPLDNSVFLQFSFREFEGDKTADNIVKFINGMLSLVHKGVVNKQVKYTMGTYSKDNEIISALQRLCYYICS